jgi:gamma-glutamyl hydrolase
MGAYKLSSEMGSVLARELRSRFHLECSYVKFVESAGARVVPIHFDSRYGVLTTLYPAGTANCTHNTVSCSEDDIKALLKSVNGVLFPGGGADIGNKTAFAKSSKLIYDSVLEMNKAGDYFPLYGTCMGFQQLVVLTSESDSIICPHCYDSEGMPLPLDFTPEARASKLFKGMDSSLYAALGKENITENSHHDGIDPSSFVTNQQLKVSGLQVQ